MARGLEKVSLHFNLKGQCQRIFKYCTIVPISHANKIGLKILQARLQQYKNQELPDVQAGFRKGRTRDQIPNIRWITEKVREFQKNICFIDYSKAFDSVDHNSYGKFLKRWEYQTTLPASFVAQLVKNLPAI